MCLSSLETRKFDVLRKSDFLPFLIFFIAIFTTSHVSAADWVPIKDSSLMVQAGSILDFSRFNSLKKPIIKSLDVDKHGVATVAGSDGGKSRFLIANISFGISVGGFPDKKIIDLYVQQLILNGYNLARLDVLEMVLMNGKEKDFDYNRQQFDRFHYLVYQLKQNGIYLILNGLSTNSGGYGNIVDRWKSNKGLSLGVHFSPEKQAHWKKLIRTMYGVKNPYTGISTLEDPTVFGIILAKENNLSAVNKAGKDKAAKLAFSSWLKRKYGSQKGLIAAWGSELHQGEHLDNGSVNFPRVDSWVSKRMADAQAFNLEIEEKTARWMTRYLREQGFRGMVTAYNFIISPANHATRANFSWVDMHNYFAHPKYQSESAIRVRQDSMLAADASYIGELISARHLNKFYTVTEHGQVFWNPYRRENALALPAYAAFQNWQGICQHASTISLSYHTLSGREDIIRPFRVGVDPIAKVTERLSALLYLRGDVAKSKHLLAVEFGRDEALNKSAYHGAIPKDVDRLGLVTGLGLIWSDRPDVMTVEKDGVVKLNEITLSLVKQSGNTLNFPIKMKNNLIKVMTDSAPGVVEKINKSELVARSKWSTRLHLLKGAGWFSARNLTNASNRVYHSDTDEILLDAKQRKMTVITPKTEAIVFDDPSEVSLKQLKIISAEGPALVSISAMDDNPLSTSQRILLMLATDARNSHMQFHTSKNVLAHDLGKLPVLMRANKIKLAIKNTKPSQLKAFSLNLRGQRQDEIPVKYGDNGIVLDLDIRNLTHGATNYFELVAINDVETVS